jgi:hypothetical protein
VEQALQNAAGGWWFETRLHVSRWGCESGAVRGRRWGMQ